MPILVVDDTDDTRILFRAMLESLGYVVLEAASAKDAIRLAVEKLPDLVLMDLRMPYVDGLLATGAFRAIRGLEEVPIIAITAHYSDQTKQQALAAGCNECIAKPITREQLAAVVGQYTRGSHRRADVG